MKKKINMGARYLFLNNDAPYNEKQLEPFLNRPVGRFRNVDIFALK